MTTLADGVARWLASLGLATYSPNAATGDTFLGYAPQTPDACLSISVESNGAPMVNIPLDESGFQLRARGVAYDYEGPIGVLKGIFDHIHGATNVDLPNGVHVISCDAAQSEPASLGMDNNNRWELVQNYDCRVMHRTTSRP